MGDEAKSKGAHVILGPTINMQRSPLGGRGFESISEDPILAGLGASSLIKGIQSTGVQACIKHFVCNDQEDKRNACQAIITDRALREIYTKPFQLTVRDSSPACFMTAYNGINGTYCSDNKQLLDDILRKEWGWKGLIMSDWFGVYSTTESVLAGCELEMPGPPRFRGDPLKFNVATDKITEYVLDERAKTVLELVRKCAASGVPENAEEVAANTPETAALLRKIGNESIVLLKNDNNVLPLNKDKKTVVIGPNAKVATYHGGGSASLAAFYAVTPFDGISAKLLSPPEYTVGCYSHKMLPLLGYTLKTPDGKPGMTMKAYNEAPDVPSRDLRDQVDVDKTEIFLADYYNDKVSQPLWYADFEGSFVAEETCTFEFGLTVVGTAKLYVNGDLVIDNATKQTKGDFFFDCATIEETGNYDLKKGETYNVKVEFGSIATYTLEAPAMFANGAVRIGGCKVIDYDTEVAKAAELAKDADNVIICAGLNDNWETEGSDRAGMDLPPGMDGMIEAVAKANPNTVVVMQSGTPVTMPWIGSVAGIIHAWYGGNETGNTIADVLFGDYNPSGKLSLSFPKRCQDNPAYLNYRAEGGRVLYGEDIYIGYRYYDRLDLPVLFPFGYGLSYTTFSFSNPSVKVEDTRVSFLVAVKNTGSVNGAEVVQAYVTRKHVAKLNTPKKELQAFIKVELESGEEKTVTMDVELKYAANPYWDEFRNMFCVEKGEYEVLFANSSVCGEGTVKASFEVPKSFWWSGV